MRFVKQYFGNLEFEFEMAVYNTLYIILTVFIDRFRVISKEVHD